STTTTCHLSASTACPCLSNPTCGHLSAGSCRHLSAASDGHIRTRPDRGVRTPASRGCSTGLSLIRRPWSSRNQCRTRNPISNDPDFGSVDLLLLRLPRIETQRALLVVIA